MAFAHGHQGLKYDEAAGLYDSRLRPYDPELGRFTSQDPVGYLDGMSRYQGYGSSPGNYVDPAGLFSGLPGNAVPMPGLTPPPGGWGDGGITLLPAMVGMPGKDVLILFGDGEPSQNISIPLDDGSKIVIRGLADGYLIEIWTPGRQMFPTDGISYPTVEQAIENVERAVAHAIAAAKEAGDLARAEALLTGLEIAAAFVPGATAADKLQQGKYGEAGTAAAIDVAAIATGVLLAKALTAGKAAGAVDDAAGLARGPATIGRAGEDAVSGLLGIPRNAGVGRVTIPGTGRGGFRVPDFAPALTIAIRGTVVEVKNVLRLYITPQLRDLVAFARSRGVPLEIFTNAPAPTNGELFRLIQRGLVILTPIP